MKKFTNISNFCTFFEHLHCHDCQFKKQWKLNLWWRLLQVSGGSRISPQVGASTLQGRGRQHTILPNFPKTAWKWKNLDCHCHCSNQLKIYLKSQIYSRWIWRIIFIISFNLFALLWRNDGPLWIEIAHDSNVERIWRRTAGAGCQC